MIARLRLAVRLITFAAALWMLSVVTWGLASGSKQIETPLSAGWVLLAGIVMQLGLWLASKFGRAS